MARERGHPQLRVAVLIFSIALAVVLVGHRVIPGAAGSLTDSLLPWLALPLPVLIAIGLVRRRGLVLAATMVPTVIWAAMFGQILTDRASSEAHNLRVASLNLGQADPSEALRPLVDARADIVVLQEVTEGNRDSIAAVLEPGLPFEAHRGTVAVFSRLPLSDTEPVDIGIGWTRALRTTVQADRGPVRLYAAHLASARPTMTAERDRTLATLAAEVTADPSDRVLLAGDLNTTTTDRRFAILGPLVDTQEQAGDGFGFTWPARMPVLRPDHILQRGLAARSSSVIVAPGSDHRAVIADLDTITR